MDSVNLLNWELSVLSKAVTHPNLTVASSHVGLSQPQLSRIIARLEQSLDVILLDRETKKKSTWTPQAQQVADRYHQLVVRWKGDLSTIRNRTDPDHLRIGTLEGQASLATQFAQFLFNHTNVKQISLDVHDIHLLEDQFLNGQFDFLFSFRTPGRKKFRYQKILGYQTFEKYDSIKKVLVLSGFEYESELHYLKTEKDSHVLVSNSLSVRKNWLKHYGGRGRIPSPVQLLPTEGSKSEPVYLIGTDRFSNSFWKKIDAFTPKPKKT